MDKRILTFQSVITSSTFHFNFVLLCNSTSNKMSSNFWKKIENIINEKVPPCVIKILDECGYCSLATICDLSAEAISEIEKFVDENLKHIVEKLNCCNAVTYRNQKSFRFLPGHRFFILNLKSRLGPFQSTFDSANGNSVEDYSPFLRVLAETAHKNAKKVPTQHRYDKTIQDFAMYIHMVCGKTCYETLSANLPMPKSSTVCK